MKKIENQYKTELNAVKKYIDNEYIYDIFYKYGFTINNKFIPLHSNITPNVRKMGQFFHK